MKEQNKMGYLTPETSVVSIAVESAVLQGSPTSELEDTNPSDGSWK